MAAQRVGGEHGGGGGSSVLMAALAPIEEVCMHAALCLVVPAAGGRTVWRHPVAPRDAPSAIPV
jgi:hypothetical protein